jgi:hypothetical protein
MKRGYPAAGRSNRRNSGEIADTLKMPEVYLRVVLSGKIEMLGF